MRKLIGHILCAPLYLLTKMAQIGNKMKKPKTIKKKVVRKLKKK